MDHKDRHPEAGAEIAWPATSGSDKSWMEQLAHYAPDKDFYSGCPTYPQDSPYHYFLSGRAAYLAAGNSFAATNTRRIQQPSYFITGGDNQIDFNVIDADKDDYTQECVFNEADSRTWPAQHNGSMNLMFADGHAELTAAFDPARMTYRYDEMKGLGRYIKTHSSRR